MRKDAKEGVKIVLAAMDHDQCQSFHGSRMPTNLIGELDVEVTIDDVCIGREGGLPVVSFSKRVHNSIDDKALLNPIHMLWSLAGEVILVDLDNYYYLTMESYFLNDGRPFVQGFGMDQTPWLAVDLDKSLISSICIDGNCQTVKYDGAANNLLWLWESRKLEEACIVPIVTLNITKDFGSVMVPFALARGKESSLVSSGPNRCVPTKKVGLGGAKENDCGGIYLYKTSGDERDVVSCMSLVSFKQACGNANGLKWITWGPLGE
ncbi:hypothetical protein GQ457_04G015500 [Hibiscus cannabinus]